LQKPANNFFADVVQASQGGLSQYQSQGQQPKPRKSSSNAQQQQVSYDAYNKLMQQLIKESKQKSTATTQKQSSYRKHSASSRTRTKSQQEQHQLSTVQQKYYDQALPKQNTIQPSKPQRDSSGASGHSQQQAMLTNFLNASKLNKSSANGVYQVT